LITITVNLGLSLLEVAVSAGLVQSLVKVAQEVAPTSASLNAGLECDFIQKRRLGSGAVL